MGVVIPKLATKEIPIDIELDSIKFDFSQALAETKNAYTKVAITYEGQTKKNLVDYANFMSVYQSATSTQKTVLKQFFKTLIATAVNKILAAYEDEIGELIVLTVDDIPDSIFI